MTYLYKHHSYSGHCHRDWQNSSVTIFLKTFSVPAQILTAPDKVIVTEGETIHMTCSIEGNPTPAINWRVNDELLVVDDRHQVAATPESVTLTISTALVPDTAIYNLTVKNDIGFDSTHISVTVKRK